MPALRGMVLYYNAGSPQEGSRAKAVFAAHRLRIKNITPEELGRSVGSFTGLLPAGEAPAGEPIPESMMVFSGVRGRELDQVLSALLRAGVPRAVYKAVVTHGNAGWDFYRLYEELRRERAAVEGAPAPEEAP